DVCRRCAVTRLARSRSPEFQSPGNVPPGRHRALVGRTLGPDPFRGQNARDEIRAAANGNALAVQARKRVESRPVDARDAGKIADHGTGRSQRAGAFLLEQTGPGIGQPAVELERPSRDRLVIARDSKHHAVTERTTRARRPPQTGWRPSLPEPAAGRTIPR